MIVARTSQRTLTYFIRGSITGRLTSCLTGQDSAALLMLNQIEIYKFGRIQASQTGGQPSSNLSPYEESQYYLRGTTTLLNKVRQIDQRMDNLCHNHINLITRSPPVQSRGFSKHQIWGIYHYSGCRINAASQCRTTNWQSSRMVSTFLNEKRLISCNFSRALVQR